jgi:hypothetical protein
MRWTVSDCDVLCGYCGHVIPPNQPIALVTEKCLIRCRTCAGGPVNQEEVDNERFRLEADRQASEAARLRRFELSTQRHHPTSMQPLSAAAAGLFDHPDSKPKAAGD